MAMLAKVALLASVPTVGGSLRPIQIERVTAGQLANRLLIEGGEIVLLSKDRNRLKKD